MTIDMKLGNKEIANVNQEERLVRGFLFACTNKSESECLSRLLLATDKIYGPVVIRIRKGDLLFLNNVDTDKLWGVFEAVSDGGVNIQEDAFKGRYPYQVKVEKLGEMKSLPDAKNILKKLEIRRNTPIFKKKLVTLLEKYVEPNPTQTSFFKK